jgi:DNA-binding NtrC family response regulator
LLADRFLAAAAERHRKAVPGIDAAAMDRLVRFAWPGNVRELQNEIERAVALARSGVPVGVGQLSPKLVPAGNGAAAGPEPDDGRDPAATLEAIRPEATLRDARTAFERRFVVRVLERHQGNVSRAARALGLSRVALHRKLKGHGLR